MTQTFDTPAAPGERCPAKTGTPDITQNPTYQAFLRKAQELGTEDALLAKSARRDRLLKLLRPVDYLTQTGVALRAGALALAWSPLICAAPFIYSRFGLNAVIYDSLLPASLFTAMLFWAVKTLQKSPWARIQPDTEYAVELEHTVAQRDETRQLRDAILRLRSNLYVADLKLLAAYNSQRQSESRSITAG